MLRSFILCLLLINFLACSKSEKIYVPAENKNAYQTYKEGLDAFKKNDFFFASKKFSEAELQFKVIELAAKSSIMSAFSLYGINFYDESLSNIERYLKTYPSDKNIIYANYLEAIIYFEQISDEKKDLEPLLLAKEKIDFFLDEYPNSEYAIDLNFKKDLIINQLAAKELYVAKYYISIQKWVPAMNRLKKIVEMYEKTVFIEEALHRLVEINYKLGLTEESQNYANILGYNYLSSDWYKKSYKIFNKDYSVQISKKIKKDKKGVLDKFKKLFD